MKKLFLKSLFTTTLVASAITNAYAEHKILKNYDELLNALTHGDRVRGIVTFDKCTFVNKNNEKQPIPYGGKGLILGKDFDIFTRAILKVNGGNEKHVISTTDSRMIDHSQVGYTSNYGYYTIFEDNSVIMHSAYFDTLTNKSLISNYAKCQISNGQDQNGLVLYDLDK